MISFGLNTVRLTTNLRVRDGNFKYSLSDLNYLNSTELNSVFIKPDLKQHSYHS